MVLVERIVESTKPSGLIIPFVEGGQDKMNLARIIAVPGHISDFSVGDVVYVKVRGLELLSYQRTGIHRGGHYYELT
jgi:hypothetical protein